MAPDGNQGTDFPAEPDVPPEQRIATALRLRYEDISQTGHVLINALPFTMGELLWARRIYEHPISRAIRSGIIPILTRLTLEGGGTVSTTEPLDARGAYQLAHSLDADGNVDRLIMRLWVTLSAQRVTGEPVFVGRAYAEDVFTRLFAPPSERKVSRFATEGLPDVPPTCVTWRAPEVVLELPEGAEPIDAEPVVDPAPLVFGLAHTDSNQHVNSLVYPRLFEEAALRRFDTLGRASNLLARYADVGYRKPCFAGDRMRVVLRAFRLDGRLGAVGGFIPQAAVPREGAPMLNRYHCFLRMLWNT